MIPIPNGKNRDIKINENGNDINNNFYVLFTFFSARRYLRGFYFKQFLLLQGGIFL